MKCDRKNNLLSEINLSKFREYPQIARHVCKSQHESKVPGSIRPCCMLHRRYVPGPYAVTCDDRIGAYRRSANGDGATPPLPLSLRPFPASLFRPRQFPYSFPLENPPSSSAPPRPPLPSPYANPAAPSSPSPDYRVAGADGAPVAPAGGGHGIPLRRGCGPAVRDATNRYARKDVSFLWSM